MGPSKIPSAVQGKQRGFHLGVPGGNCWKKILATNTSMAMTLAYGMCSVWLDSLQLNPASLYTSITTSTPPHTSCMMQPRHIQGLCCFKTSPSHRSQVCTEASMPINGTCTSKNEAESGEGFWGWGESRHGKVQAAAEAASQRISVDGGQPKLQSFRHGHRVLHQHPRPRDTSTQSLPSGVPKSQPVLLP